MNYNAHSMKNFLIPIASLIICFAVIWKWTKGLTAFTIFSYTLKEAGNTPRVMPDLVLASQNNVPLILKDKKKYILLNFVYLNCPFVCHKVNNQLEKIYHQLNSLTIPSRLEFVTVSFDLKNDGIQKLKKYRSYFGTNIEGWTFAMPYKINQQEFDQFLHKLGVWKYTLPSSGLINHSIYLFLINDKNDIIKIFDPARESNLTIASQIESCINKEEISL